MTDDEEKKNRQREYHRRYKERHRDKLLARARELDAGRPEKVREKMLRQRYGMTLDDYDKLLQLQDHKCAICMGVERVKNVSGKIKQLSVDHCHNTGNVRGLLCDACNVGLGRFSDDPDRVDSAARYLRMNDPSPTLFVSKKLSESE